MKGNYISYYLPTVIENEMKYILFSPPPPPKSGFFPLSDVFFFPPCYLFIWYAAPSSLNMEASC